MSKFLFLDTEFNDRNLFHRALRDLTDALKIGFRHGDALPLYGYLGDRRAETAEYRIDRKYIRSGANDLGFAWDGEQYQVIISEYDQGELNNDPNSRQAQIVNGLRQRYAVLAQIENMREKGYDVARQWTDGDGNVRLSFRPGRNYRPQQTRKSAQQRQAMARR